MKNFPVVIEVEEQGKRYAYMIKVSDNENILKVLSNINGIISATMCKTQKDAKYKVSHYNAVYKANGINLY